MTSGRWVRYSARACSPLEASAQTDHVGLERHDAGQSHPDQVVIVDQHQFQLVRHDAPSAPAAPAPDPTVCAAPARVTVSTRARAWRAVELQHAAQLVDALADAEQAEMARRADRCAPFANPAAVVAHRQLDAVRLEPQHGCRSAARRSASARWSAPRGRCAAGGARATASRRRGDPSTRHPCRDAGRSVRRLLGQVGERAGEIAALERLRAQIHHRAPRFLLAVVQHPARDVQRLPRRVRATSSRLPPTASSCSAMPASPCSSVSCSSRATRLRSVSTA